VCNVDLNTQQLQPSSLPRNKSLGIQTVQSLLLATCVKMLENASGTQQVGMPNVYAEGLNP
jgi:hypothetical protein